MKRWQDRMRHVWCWYCYLTGRGLGYGRRECARDALVCAKSLRSRVPTPSG